MAHVGLADPFCADFSELVYEAVQQTGATVHRGATFVTIEGPRFSTKAESQLFRQWGIDIIGMTAIPEANLAREAEICYACMAHVTDYDVWHVEEEPVTVTMVIERLLANVRSQQAGHRQSRPDAARRTPLRLRARAATDALITNRDGDPRSGEARSRAPYRASMCQLSREAATKKRQRRRQQRNRAPERQADRVIASDPPRDALVIATIRLAPMLIATAGRDRRVVTDHASDLDTANSRFRPTVGLSVIRLSPLRERVLLILAGLFTATGLVLLALVRTQSDERQHRSATCRPILSVRCVGAGFRGVGGVLYGDSRAS